MERIDISTNSKSIKEAYEKVVRGNSDATYSIFSVDKNGVLQTTNVSSGPLNEFIEEFSDGIIQFGMARVTVPGSDVSKNLLLGWCPDNAPAKSRLSYAANFAEISKVLSGYHVQITARDQDDLDVEEFVTRVAAAAGARYTAHASSTVYPKKPSSLNHLMEGRSLSKPFKPASKPSPIGSSGQPAAKINRKPAIPGSDDDDGWAGEKELEERDLDVKPLESVPSAYKPTKVNITELRLQKSDTVSSKPITVSSNTQSFEEPSDGRLTALPKPRVGGSVASRYKATAETDSAGTAFGAKPIVNSKQKNNVLGGLSRDFGSSGGKTPAQLWAEKKGMYKDVKKEDSPVTSENHDIQSDDHELNVAAQDNPIEEDDDEKEKDDEREKDNEEALLSPGINPLAKRVEELNVRDDITASNSRIVPERQNSSSKSEAHDQISAKADYDYEKDEDNELEFKEDDMIVDIEFTDKEWWSGTNKRTGELGLFPSSYVTLSNDSARDANEPASVSEEPQESEEKSKTAIAQYAYEKDEDNEIAFAEGDLIVEVEFVDDSWWSGKNSSTGEKGLFPANYVELN